jgi:apolipoprotein N-acyltransferase
LNDLPNIVTFPIFITLIDYSIYKLFPWHVGDTQSYNYYFIQISDVISVHGVTYLTVLIGVQLYNIIEASIINKKAFPLTSSLVIFSIVIITYFYGIVRSTHVENHKSEQTITISSVQTNSISSPVISEKKYNEAYNNLVRLLKQVINSNVPSLIIIPEGGIMGSFNYSLNYNKSDYNSNVKKLITDFCKRNDLYILFNDKNLQPSKIVFSFYNKLKYILNSSIFHKAIYELKRTYYNASHMINPKGNVEHSYWKNNLLPFGEYFPICEEIKKLLPPDMMIGKFNNGNLITSMEINGIEFGTPICYEALFSELITKFKMMGAEFIVNQSNEEWFGSGKELEQYLYLLRARAIENRIPIIKASNTGASCFISASGNFFGEHYNIKGERTKINTYCSQHKTIGYSTAKISFYSGRSLYTCYGDIFVLFIAIFGIGSVVYKLPLKFKNRNLSKKKN